MASCPAADIVAVYHERWEIELGYGEIEGYAALVDKGRYGLPLDIFVRIKLARHTEETARAFEDHVQAVDEILTAT